MAERRNVPDFLSHIVEDKTAVSFLRSYIRPWAGNSGFVFSYTRKKITHVLSLCHFGWFHPWLSWCIYPFVSKDVHLTPLQDGYPAQTHKSRAAATGSQDLSPSQPTIKGRWVLPEIPVYCIIPLKWNLCIACAFMGAHGWILHCVLNALTGCSHCVCVGIHTQFCNPLLLTITLFRYSDVAP